MRKVEHRLRLDLLRGGNQGYIRVKRGENGARRLAIALYMHSVPYMADAGTTAVFRAIKPDNTQLFNSATITDNVVTVGLTTQTVAALGTVRCELSIYGMNNELLYSPQFDVIVEDYLYSDTAIESTNEYTNLTEALSTVNNIVSTEAARVAAENQRVANENARVSAEAERASAETARAEAEESRATLYAEWNGLTVEAQDGDAADAELNDVSGHKNILFTLPRGKGFTVLGQFMTLEALQSAVTTPKGGDAYGVGSTAPYDIYIWDKVENKWKNHGKLQGPRGEPGLNEISTDTATALNGLLKGNGSTVQVALPGVDYAAPATDTVVTAPASAWSNNTITLSVTGVMADSKLEIGLSETATDEQYAAATAAQIRATGSGDGTVTLKAVAAPSVDLPILIRRFSGGGGGDLSDVTLWIADFSTWNEVTVTDGNKDTDGREITV